MDTTINDALVSTVERPLSRRGLLAGAMLGAVGLVLPVPALAAGGEWRLAFRNVHNNEVTDALFARNGQFVGEGLAELNHGLRDWRTGEVTHIDRRLLALLVRVRDTLGVAPNRRIDLISGYRSPKTNAGLRAAGHSGVASRSQHMLGHATDIAIPGVSLDRLRAGGTSLQAGGVGFYPRDGFVHVDNARVRTWHG